MSVSKTVGDLRREVSSAAQRWTVDPRLQDNAPLPVYHLGGDLTKVPKATAVPRVNIAPYLSATSANTFLMRQRIERGFIDAKTLDPLVRVAPVNQATSGGASPESVDWRNRFGWPWLTNIKDQGGCKSCWVFSAVGVVEAMTRIEHCAWSLRSAGFYWTVECKRDGPFAATVTDALFKV